MSTFEEAYKYYGTKDASFYRDVEVKRKSWKWGRIEHSYYGTPMRIGKDAVLRPLTKKDKEATDWVIE